MTKIELFHLWVHLYCRQADCLISALLGGIFLKLEVRKSECLNLLPGSPLYSRVDAACRKTGTTDCAWSKWSSKMYFHLSELTSWEINYWICKVMGKTDFFFFVFSFLRPQNILKSLAVTILKNGDKLNIYFFNFCFLNFFKFQEKLTFAWVK